MFPELQLDTVHTMLDTNLFSKMFNNTTQSYKFYWFEAILNLITTKEDDLTYNEIVDEMICEVWHTVTHYHLRLGPIVNGNAENFLEHAVKVLNENATDLSQNPSKEEIKAAIDLYDHKLKKDKMNLVNYVPYKLLYPFFDVAGMEEGLEYIRRDKRSHLISYMSRLSGKENVLYTILDGEGLQKKVRMHPDWRTFILKNYAVIQSWVQYHKAQFLQDRNPGVPGIIYKINPEEDYIRKLDQVRDLWKTVVGVTGQPIKEIYTGQEISLDTLSIDHFVPRSYISNDELWNLIPMRKTLNSSKSNRLPSWDDFFGPFVKYQYYLYDLIFPRNEESKSEAIIHKFEKCRRNNLNAIWAAESLYITGNTEEQFTNILSHNLKPIYEAAQLQGYDTWRMDKV